MNELLSRDFAEAKKRIAARRLGFDAPCSLDAFFIERAHARAAMQPRCDATINQLPVLGVVPPTALVPIWNNGETYAALASALVAVTPSANLPVFNVKNFGATGNGTTDDTAAIQATINACIAAGGGIIFCPAGTYLISSTLTFVGGFQANLSFVFMGAGGYATTILQSNLSANVFASAPYPSGSSLTGCAFRDFGVDFTGTPTGGYVFNFPWVGATENNADFRYGQAGAFFFLDRPQRFPRSGICSFIKTPYKMCLEHALDSTVKAETYI